ncbi:hypothetical protein GSI_02039 [Ganoderma sinense ZZ0214-1]|uniref:AB hydrolase-1 domain-containing protein n=1 Tax=Ganoderma sinense ZZ0214-1 TaxID=1077348 RepID=A0A2G8SNG9_9APHY|nr:hypothetical protein GSI_02039 [Ganoderma sinense ZZ0214-1]
MTKVEPTCTTKLIDLPHGVILHTERHRVGTDAPSMTVVCIHGLGSTSTAFYPIIKHILTALPAAHLIAYDWAGSGSSPRPSSVSDRTVADHVSDLDALIGAEAPSGPLVILAHSAGTHLASRWLLTPSPHVTRVTHAIYLGGPINIPLSPEVTTMQLDLATTIAAGGPAAVVDSLAPMLLGATSMVERPVAVTALRAIMLAQSAEGYAAAIRAFSKNMGEGDAPVDWAAIRDKVKILVVAGEEDVLLGQTEVAGFLERAVVKKIARAGHTLTLEAPEETAKMIVEFLQN